MIVSPFTPLFFIDRKADGLESEYVQTFSTTDHVLLQILSDVDEPMPTGYVTDSSGKKRLFDIVFKKWNVNTTNRLYFADLCFGKGDYAVWIDGVGHSEPFIATDDELTLKKTTLIQYSTRSNRERTDAIFYIDGMQRFFDFRVPGGFKDTNWAFAVESEQFTTPFADISQLYGLESTQKKFTLGGALGVPIWFGEMLNRILVCSHVYFDGVKYTRKESNVPELSSQIEGLNSFVFTQNLQRSVNLDPTIESQNMALMRRVGLEDGDYRKTKYDINRIIK